MSFGVAAMSYRYLEAPTLRLKRHFPGHLAVDAGDSPPMAAASATVG